MKTAIRNNWIFISILLLFIILKIPHLSYPFYWDESWPYASGANQMYIHGPSLMPGAISGELSRGHPLMFHFLEAVWMRFLGSSYISMHSFPLLIAVMLLMAVYVIAEKLTDKNSAIICTLVIAFQQMFFVQASMVLIEILLSLLVFLSIYFYYSKKYLYLAIAMTMLYYTKESGIVLGIVLGIDCLFSFFRKDIANAEKIKKAISLSIPVLLFGVFLLLQKAINGWYVLPLYSVGFTRDWEGFYSGFKECLNVLFKYDCRSYFYIILLILSVIAAFRHKQALYATTSVPFIIALVIMGTTYQPVLSYLLFILFSVSYLLSSFYIAKHLNKKYNIGKRYFILSYIFVLCFIIFSASFSFVIVRYLLPALIIQLFLTTILIVYFINSLAIKKYFPLLIIVVVCIEAYGYKKYNNLSDCSLGAFDGMYVQSEAMRYVDSHHYNNNCIAVFGYLQMLHLIDNSTGYRHDTTTYSKVKWGVGECADVIMLENIEFKPALDTSLKCRKDTSFVLSHRSARGKAWSEVFIRKNLLQK